MDLHRCVQIFTVLPDDSTNVSCPSQRCATLSQYLLDNNGTLPIVSNVEYHFLPGEHCLPPSTNLWHLNDITLMRVTSNKSSSAELASYSQQLHLLAFYNSNKIKISNIMFK